jgi:hypothetical protein
MMIGAEGAGPYDQPPLTGRKKNKKERWAQEREDSFTNPDSTGDESMGGASVNDEARETDLLRLMVKAWEFKMISLALKNKEKALDLTYEPPRLVEMITHMWIDRVLTMR